MSQSVAECRRVSQSVAECRRASQSDAIILLCNTQQPMETAALKYCNSLHQSATRVAEIEKVLSLRHSATLHVPRTIEVIACCCYCTNITGKKMAAFNEESLAFLEEVRKYECLYNKFNKDFKNKFKKYNCWVEISEKCGMSAEDCEKKFRNLRSSCGRMLRKRKFVPSGSGREAVSDEGVQLDWFSNTIDYENENIENEVVLDQVKSDEDDDCHAGGESCDVAISEPEVDNDGNGRKSAESTVRNSKQTIPAVKNKLSSADSLLKRRPWPPKKNKTSKLEIDVAFLESAKSSSDATQAIRKRKADTASEDDSDTLYCRSLVPRMRRLSQHGKAFVRYHVEQTFYQAEFGSQQVQGIQRFGNPIAPQLFTQQRVSPTQINISFLPYRGLLDYGSTPKGSSTEGYNESISATSTSQ